jgi:uncharacterized protein (DUF1684 family)
VKFRRWAGLPLALAVLPVALAAVGTTDYRAEIQAWRDARETRLKGDDGWLTVAGLFWLKEGPNRFGSAKDNDIVLPAAAPAHAGVFEFKAGKTTARLNDDARATAEGKPVTTLEMRADTSGGEPEVLTIGHLRMFIIERGGRYGVRLKDSDSERRKNFTGLRWFPISESYRVTARFVPVNPRRRSRSRTSSARCRIFPARAMPSSTSTDRSSVSTPSSRNRMPRSSSSSSGTARAARRPTAPAASSTPRSHTTAPSCSTSTRPSPAVRLHSLRDVPLPPKQNRLSVRIEAGR